MRQGPRTSRAGWSSRREILRAGGLGLLGLGLPDLLRARRDAEAAAGPGRAASFGRAKSCLFILLKGGVSHIDTFDLKPDAPAGIRGEFRPIATAAPGLSVCEHLPMLARRADRFAVIRSLGHDNVDHASAAYWMTTGFAYPRALNLAAEGTREDHPQIGSTVAAREFGRARPVPPFVMVPSYLVVQGQLRSGQYAGFLGSGFDPMVPPHRPDSPAFDPAALGLAPPFEPGRLRGLRVLRAAIDAGGGRAGEYRGGPFDGFHEQAFALLESGRTRRAFDLDAEPEPSRDRYGRDLFGRSVLLARRLVEAGVRLVHVNWVIPDGGTGWDTHKNNFGDLKTTLLPPLDRAASALLDDLAGLGLLDETLVVITGEFGRTPRINDNQAGRDHWAPAFSAVVAGAGIPGGAVLGATDRHAAYPVDRPVTPGDLAATIFHALGIDPASRHRSVPDRLAPICAGAPALELWGSPAPAG